MGKKIFLLFICMALFLSVFAYVEKVKADLPGGPEDYCWVGASNGNSGIYYFYQCNTSDCRNKGPANKYCGVFEPDP